MSFAEPFVELIVVVLPVRPNHLQTWNVLAMQLLQDLRSYQVGALAVLKRVIDETPRPIQDILPDVPDWLCANIAKLHASKPEGRFQSAREVADLLGRCQASLQQLGRVELPGEFGAFLPKPVDETKSKAVATGNTGEKPAVLPPEAFELRVVDLFHRPAVSDTGLANFANCKHITALVLAWAPVTDAGLARFKDCQQITFLQLDHTRLGDAGLAHFKDCRNLTYLNLGATAVTDDGLSHFKNCKNVTNLQLVGTRVTDTGVAHFQGCKNLDHLNLQGTQVTDQGLAQFTGYPRLKFLNVKETRVTAVGVRQVSDALPACKIEWDGGVLEPKSGQDKRQ